MLIINGVFIEGEKVTVVIDGKQITRTVKYNRTDGLYIVYQNRRYFEYEFQKQANHIGYTVEKEEDMYKIIFDDGNIKMVVGTDLTFAECNDIINRQLEPSFYKIVPMQRIRAVLIDRPFFLSYIL